MRGRTLCPVICLFTLSRLVVPRERFGSKALATRAMAPLRAPRSSVSVLLTSRTREVELCSISKRPVGSFSRGLEKYLLSTQSGHEGVLRPPYICVFRRRRGGVNSRRVSLGGQSQCLKLILALAL
jgi:hypothetical protein